MANVEHSTLTTTNLHENKGVSTATDNTVATAVTGATVWAKLTASNLTGTGNSFGGQLLHARDEKGVGIAGGTFTSGAFRTRTLNQIKTNEISGSSLTSNQITLPAGTYYIHARAPAFYVTAHQTRWQNITDGATTISGAAASAPGSTTGNDSFINGRFTIAGSKTFELQHICQTTVSTNGFGLPTAWNPIEVYSEVMIWKVL